jgi:hypothetical protein
MTKVLDLFKKTLSLATAVVFGERVSDERIAKRLAICSNCDMMIIKKDPGTGEEVMGCGVCGCRLKGDRALNNLALYEETDKYGCKHRQGSKWKQNNV